MNWHNVSKKEPCPICHKTDWCNLSNDGAVCICHRVESPHLARSGSGWIHRLIDRPPSNSSHKSYSSHQPSTTLDFEKVHHSYDNDPTLIEGLATTIGVDDLALKSLDVRFNRFDECWSFPMRNAEGNIIGLRFRELAGSRKWSARGSKDGLFYSTVHLHLSPSPKEMIIVEGPSDTAAAMSLFGVLSEENEPSTESSCGVSRGCDWAKRSCGVARAEKTTIPSAGVVAAQVSPNFAYRESDLRSNPNYIIVGRSSCQTGTQHLRALIRRVRPRIVTIVADNDAPGIKGAELLAQQLTNHQSPITNHLPVRILVVPAPYKDLRAWYLSNTLTPRLFADIASAQRWR